MVDVRSRLHRAFLDDFCTGFDLGQPVLGFRDWLAITPLAVGLTVGLAGCRQASNRRCTFGRSASAKGATNPSVL